VDGGGPVHGVVESQEYTDNVCDKLQVEADDFATLQKWICVSRRLPALFFESRV
jgi:hypothetical protein